MPIEAGSVPSPALKLHASSLAPRRDATGEVIARSTPWGDVTMIHGMNKTGASLVVLAVAFGGSTAFGQATGITNANKIIRRNAEPDPALGRADREEAELVAHGLAMAIDAYGL